MKTQTIIAAGVLTVSSFFFAQQALAVTLSGFRSDGWIQIADNDGVVTPGSFSYYSGDLAFPLDGDNSHYEYAFDFGLYTESYHQEYTDIDSSGLYENVQWNNDIYFNTPSPFAMQSANLIDTGFTSVRLEGDSYYRIVTFDNTSVDLSSFNVFDAHWTMSCSNDAINGNAPVPEEPTTMLLFGTGLSGLATTVRRKKIKKA